MIITKLVGGLGNQMFQYAAGCAVALRNKSKFELDISGFEFQNKLDTPRNYELDIFNLKNKFADLDEVYTLKGNSGSFIERVIKNRIPSVGSFLFTGKKTYFYENINHKFEDRILKIFGDAYLEGWWQSEKYFKDYEKEIRKDFTFNTKIPRLVNTVSVHVRRGDYASKYSGYWYLCPPSYYENGIKIISREHKIKKILVFCDEPEWAKQNLKFKIKTEFITQNLFKDQWKDMQLMSCCEHNIIANSSFSWWGAWLNDNPKKIVVAPKKWINDPKIDTSSQIPDNWIKI